MPFEDYAGCFACGKNNPAGLGLVFDYHESGLVESKFTASGYLQGFPGALHGGIIATLLDEALTHAVSSKYGNAVTAGLDLRFRNATPIGVPIEIFAEATRKKFRLVEAKAWLRMPDGTITAEAVGKFMLVTEELVQIWKARAVKGSGKRDEP